MAMVIPSGTSDPRVTGYFERTTDEDFIFKVERSLCYCVSSQAASIFHSQHLFCLQIFHLCPLCSLTQKQTTLLQCARNESYC